MKLGKQAGRAVRWRRPQWLRLPEWPSRRRQETGSSRALFYRFHSLQRLRPEFCLTLRAVQTVSASEARQPDCLNYHTMFRANVSLSPEPFQQINHQLAIAQAFMRSINSAAARSHTAKGFAPQSSTDTYTRSPDRYQPRLLKSGPPGDNPSPSYRMSTPHPP